VSVGFLQIRLVLGLQINWIVAEHLVLVHQNCLLNFENCLVFALQISLEIRSMDWQIEILREEEKEKEKEFIQSFKE
jgi:hypothetical protein